MNEHRPSVAQTLLDKLICRPKMLQNILIRHVVQSDMQMFILAERPGFVDVEVEDGENVGYPCCAEEVGLLVEGVEAADVEVSGAGDAVLCSGGRVRASCSGDRYREGTRISRAWASYHPAHGGWDRCQSNPEGCAQGLNVMYKLYKAS